MDTFMLAVLYLGGFIGTFLGLRLDMFTPRVLEHNWYGWLMIIAALIWPVTIFLALAGGLLLLVGYTIKLIIVTALGNKNNIEEDK
jgi:hypothetical protein